MTQTRNIVITWAAFQNPRPPGRLSLVWILFIFQLFTDVNKYFYNIGYLSKQHSIAIVTSNS